MNTSRHGDRRPPLRVLQIGKYYPPHTGGIETHLQTLSEKLAGRFKLEVAVSNVSRKTIREVVNGVPVVRLGRWLALASAPVNPRLWGVLSGRDIIHLHLPNPWANLLILMRRRGARIVCSYHGDVVRQKFLERIFRPLLKALLRRSEAILVATPAHVDNSPILPEFRDRCHVVPYGIDFAHFSEPQPEDEIRAIRERFGPRIVLGVGRLVYYKGFEFLLEAMQGVEGSLIIVGEGPLRPALERQVAALGLEARVYFAGAVPDTRIYYAAADVFVLPSVARSEGFGIVQLEAMAAAVPVVNTSLDTGVPFVSVDKMTGLTVPPASAGALAAAVNSLLDDPETRRLFGEAGRRRVRESFSNGVMADQVQSIYEEIYYRAERS
ncbi:MAG: glycosyltransferase, partial [Acidobacteriota bacterium]